MTASRHLTRAPITEALIDIRVEPRKEFEPATLRSAKELLQARYPGFEEKTAVEARFGLSQTGVVEAGTTSLGFQGIFAKSQDEKSVVQFRADGFTFNRLRPYTSWEAILPEALDAWASYVSLAKPEGVKRLGVRYINHLNVPRSTLDLSRLIETVPRLPMDVGGSIQSFAGRVVLRDSDSGSRAVVIQALDEGVGPDGRVLRLDIDAFTDALTSLDTSEIAAALRRLRAYTNRIFFGTLTDSFIQEFV